MVSSAVSSSKARRVLSTRPCTALSRTCADVGGEEAERDQHRQHDGAEDQVVDVAIEQDAGADAGDGDDDLHGEQPVEAEIAGNDADHAADGDDHGEDFGRRVLDDGEARKAPEAAEAGEHHRAVGGADFPFRGGLDIGRRRCSRGRTGVMSM